MAYKALLFDVFGTVVDWRASIIAEGQAFGHTRGLKVDWATFADGWRAKYQPAMERVRDGRTGWVKLDDLHRQNHHQGSWATASVGLWRHPRS